MSKTFEELAERACRPLTKGADYRTQALIGALTGGATGALSGYISADEGETRKQMLRQGLIGALAGGVGFPAVAHAFKAPKRPQAAQAASSKAEAKAPPKAEAPAPKAEAPKPEAPKAPPRVEDLPPPKPRTRVDDLVRKNVPFADSDNPAFDYGQVAGESVVGAGVGYGAGNAGSRAYQARHTTTPKARLAAGDVPAVRAMRPALADYFGPDIFAEAVARSNGDPARFRSMLVEGILAEQRVSNRKAEITPSTPLSDELSARTKADPKGKPAGRTAPERELSAVAARGTTGMRERWVNDPASKDGISRLTDEIIKSRRTNAHRWGVGGGVVGGVGLPFLTESARDYLDSRAAINQGAK